MTSRPPTCVRNVLYRFVVRTQPGSSVVNHFFVSQRVGGHRHDQKSGSKMKHKCGTQKVKTFVFDTVSVDPTSSTSPPPARVHPPHPASKFCSNSIADRSHSRFSPSACGHSGALLSESTRCSKKSYDSSLRRKVAHHGWRWSLRLSQACLVSCRWLDVGEGAACLEEKHRSFIISP